MLFLSHIAVASDRMSALFCVGLLLTLTACSDVTDVAPAEPVAGGALERGAGLAQDATFHEILRHPDSLERVEGVARYLQHAEPDDLDEVMYEIEHAPLDQGDIEYALFGGWWARFAPQAALQFADTELRMQQPRVVTAVLRTWASMDPEGLMKSGGFRNATGQMYWFRPEMADAVVVGWFESGKPGLEDFVFGLTDDESLNTALRAWIRMKILAEGAEEALAWIETTGFHADVNRELLIGALVTLAHQQPQIALEHLDKAKDRGVDVGTFVPRIANSWAHHDPEAALGWVMAYPEESVRRFNAVQRIASRWRRRDPWGMFEWLEAQDGSLDPKLVNLLRYTALPAMIRASGFRPDWQMLMDRVGLIDEENRRLQTAMNVLQRWYVADEAEATAWIAENPLNMPPHLLDRAPLLETRERSVMVRVLGLEPREVEEDPES